MGGARLGKGAHLLQPFYRVRHWGLRPFQKEGSILPALLTSLISNLISQVNGVQRVSMISLWGVEEGVTQQQRAGLIFSPTIRP